MSRLIKKPIVVPEKVKVEYKGASLNVEGPLGKLSVNIGPRVKLNVDKDKIFVVSELNDRQDSMTAGLVWAQIRNMVAGVTAGFTKQLEIRGVGYSAKIAGDKLVLQLRFTHPVDFKIPQGIKITTDQKGLFVSVTGIDKELVGETAAQIRRVFPAEHYKGTGIRYVGEYVIKKAGKTAIGVGAAGAGAAGGGKK